MMNALLSYIGIPALIQLLSKSLKHVEHPSAKAASHALDQFQGALFDGHVDYTQLKSAQDHFQKMAEIEVRHTEVAMKEINQSLRAEIQSEDRYIRRMRPTFGYLMAFTWAAQMFALAYVMIFKTSQAGAVIEAMASLGAIWAVGLSVLGIYVYKRSEDKKLGLSSPLPHLDLLPRLMNEFSDQNNQDDQIKKKGTSTAHSKDIADADRPFNS